MYCPVEVYLCRQKGGANGLGCWHYICLAFSRDPDHKGELFAVLDLGIRRPSTVISLMEGGSTIDVTGEFRVGEGRYPHAFVSGWVRPIVDKVTLESLSKDCDTFGPWKGEITQDEGGKFLPYFQGARNQHPEYIPVGSKGRKEFRPVPETITNPEGGE